MTRTYTDTERIDFMERRLRREGSVMTNDHTGQSWIPKNAWAIASELETLRETIDALMDQLQ